MTAGFTGRFRPHGDCGISIDRSGRCEIGLGSFTLDLSNDQARMLSHGLIALYGLPAEHQKALREATSPPRRLAEDAIPPLALEALGILSDDWEDIEALHRRWGDRSSAAMLQGMLGMLVNARKAERRNTLVGARHGAVATWRLNPDA
ncbi:hypothetical protein PAPPERLAPAPP_02550 [Brevundimonas phage vB_BpoS-Papperlapapp]|uniref:Uncharacterized protein n=1 Tax=Brevundimonas phage vB_BpoS-Kabachok TaxID=2948600 RepID=A0A9E7SJ33_9CAUD|nr:hypothetical protein KABACHOK_00920 [Brevundimonas phage vB_BpoS-Kabachok]USN15996.1 hypothetical protein PAPPERLAPAPP_02550 [Brevundimonas phage vB_BpoS-Papperlapapp]